jgi:hypothetical protein
VNKQLLQEIAQNFKEQGNDYFKGKRHREAISFYTQGIDAKPSDIVLHEALLCNRAACNLELSEELDYWLNNEDLTNSKRTMVPCSETAQRRSY